MRTSMRVFKILIIVLMWTVFGWAASAPVVSPNIALLLEVQGVIGPASRGFILRGLEQAQERNAAVVILQIDTPGGLDSSMRDIIQAILASPVPVIGYVAPEGARAASAGTYILYACHVAAMSPATNLGAATPVQIGGLPIPVRPSGPDQPGETSKEPLKDQPSTPQSGKPIEKTAAPAGSDMERKLINDARAYLRSLAQLRGRNAEWAGQAVTEAASLSAQEALQKDVIDLVAADISQLLVQIDGRSVMIAGELRPLATRELKVEIVTPNWRNRLLALIAHPTVAYVLMLIGIYGLFFEFSNPGAMLPGVIGGICLLLALFAFQVLSVNYAGLALLLLGLAFMAAEAFVPSFGVLGLGGIAAFVTGSLLLWDETGPGYEVPLGLIAGFALASALLLTGLAMLMLRQRHRPVVSGREELLGAIGVVTDEQAGWARIHSESWRIRTGQPLRRGERVQVVGRNGLTLIVRSLDSASAKEEPLS
ncbi:MAG TPA: nodulation protein NfeD [Candidatus Competibacteraceae bacterium]|nr:nodulation protein NfeD [Candidatus Competibacteraceae bacterium]